MGLIGVIDSGVGGLTVLQKLLQQNSHNFIYIADHAFCPYGNKPNEIIFDRASKLTQFLKSQGAQAVVLACNTISVYAQRLQQQSGLYVYDVITPTCKRIAESGAQTVALLATKSTIANGVYQKNLSAFGIQTVAFDCSAFVPFVEQRTTTSLTCQKTIADTLRRLPQTQADVVVLGCTHFPLLKKQIAYYCGASKIVQCSCDLSHSTLKAPNADKTVLYLTTGNADFADNAASWFKDGQVRFRHVDI